MYVTVNAIMFENLLARSSSLTAFQHEKEEILAGL